MAPGSRRKRERGAPDEVYNPLTGNRRFFTREEGEDEEGPPRTVNPPPHEGAGQVFRKAREWPGEPAEEGEEPAQPTPRQSPQSR